MDLMELLKGKKTYIVLFVGVAVFFLESIGILGAGSLESLTPILAMAGGATTVAKLNRLNQSLKETPPSS